MTTLFSDLQTDQEKADFFLRGVGYTTGVIAQSIQNDVALAYQRCVHYQRALQEKDLEIAKLKQEKEIA